MNFTGILVWLMGSIGSRVLISLGMGFVSFVSVFEAGQTLINVFEGYWNGLPTAVLQLISLSGFPVAIGWIIGAYVARLTLTTLPKLSRLPT